MGCALWGCRVLVFGCCDFVAFDAVWLLGLGDFCLRVLIGLLWFCFVYMVMLLSMCLRVGDDLFI